jgi:C-terminal processing protease CtpA/Prc
MTETRKTWVRLSTLAVFLCFFAEAVSAPQVNFTHQQYHADLDYLWRNISDEYAYFDQKQTDWNKVREIYGPQLDAVKTLSDFVALLESMLEELYDFHTHLNTNTASSPHLVPSGTDIWAEWKKGRAIITEVRLESRAEKAGIRIGMQVISINGIAVDEAVSRRVGKSLRSSDNAARDWALRALLAGRRNENRGLEVISNGDRQVVSIDNESAPEVLETKPLLEYRRIEKDVGYILVNNSLGDADLIKQFDLALAALKKTRGMILDLRDTPSGGNTTVARGIMGRFIRRELPYQKHSIPAEERRYGAKRSWIELASPRGDFTYGAPVVVLVNHWTGSMGEGIAVGMDGMRRATIVGTEMAGLAGATSGIRLPNTGIGVTFPTEKLFHINGTPREIFVPPVYVNLLLKGNQDGDIILNRALRVLRVIR